MPYVDGFEPLTDDERLDFIGTFPVDHAKASRLAHLPPPPSTGGWDRPSLAAGGETEESKEAFEHVNDPRWFKEPSNHTGGGKSKGKKRQKGGGKPLWSALNPPRDDLDWLAQVNEEGQDFEDYMEVRQQGIVISKHDARGSTLTATTTVNHKLHLLVRDDAERALQLEPFRRRGGWVANHAANLHWTHAHRRGSTLIFFLLLRLGGRRRLAGARAIARGAGEADRDLLRPAGPFAGSRHHHVVPTRHFQAGRLYERGPLGAQLVGGQGDHQTVPRGAGV